MYSTIYRYGLLGVAISSFFVSLIVYIKAYEDNKKSAFLLVNTATGVWALCLFIFHIYPRPQIFWLRSSHLAAIFVPVTFIHFVFILLDEYAQRKTQLTLFYLVALILGLSSFTNLSISGVTYKEIMGYHLVPGPVYKIFSAMFFLLTFYGFFLMIKALRKSSGFRKNQIRYFLSGSILGFGGAISTFLPLYNIDIPPVGILAVPCYGIILAYAMLRHRLMDIRTIVSKGLIYTTISVLVFAVFLFLRFTVTSDHKLAVPSLELFLYVVAFCFFLVLMSMPLRGRLEELIDNLIFKKARTSYDNLAKGSQKLLTILDRKTLSKFFLETVVQATDANWGALWLLDEKNGNCHLTGKVGNRKDELWLNEGRFLNQNLAMFELMKKERRLFLREEIFPFFKNMRNEGNLEDTLRRSDFSLVMPLLFRDSLKGCLFLGEKKSGDLFSSYELQALTLFGDQAVIALTNAHLFQQIQTMKEYNERIVNNVDSGFMVINGEGQITTFNRKIEEMIALSSREVLGKTPEVLPSPLNKIVLRSWRTQKPVSIPGLTLKIGQNDTLVVTLNTSLIDENERRSGIVTILTDLTEVRRLEEKIRESDKMASIGSMVAQLAHQIKNPLSSIKTFTELLPEKFEDEEFRNRFFSLVSGEIKRIDRLITRMLNLGRVDANQYKAVSIQKLIKDVLLSFDLQLRERNIKIELTHDAPLPLIRADRESLKEVFSNILINSIEAMPSGGRINISTRRKEDRNTEKALLEISITDEGGGIPKSHLRRIFDPFFTTKHRGSGLGLYVCYQIIKTHQGEINVRNTDSGANFTISLPIPENETSFVDQKRTVHG